MSAHEELEPPPVAYEYAPPVSQVWRALGGEVPLLPDSYLGYLTTSEAWCLEAARGNARQVIRALSGFAVFMHHRVRPDQRFILGQRVMARVVGEEEVTPTVINEWLTTGVEDPRSLDAITALANYILGGGANVEPEDAQNTSTVPPTESAPVRKPAPPRAPSRSRPAAPRPPKTGVEQEPAFDAITEGLSSAKVVGLIGAFVSVDEGYMKAFVYHFTRRGTADGYMAVRRAGAELEHMLDQYHAQVPGRLASDPRYEAVRDLVQGLIGYGGQSPKSIDQILLDGPYGSTPQQMSAACRQVISMLKEMLRCKVNSDPQNLGRLQRYMQSIRSTRR